MLHCINLEDYVPAFQQRTPIRESKAIFEIQFYDAKNDTDDTPMALTIISRDSQYRLFKTIYDKITVTSLHGTSFKERRR